MPSIEISNEDLLNTVKRLPPEEFDAFLQKALSLRADRRAPTLSADETRLIARVNLGLSTEVRKRMAQLTRLRKQNRLDSAQHRELLELSRLAEERDADRAAALLELAKLRGVPIRVIMKQMGIQTPAVHG